MGVTMATSIVPTKASGVAMPSGDPGQIDDGAELLGQASISLGEEISAAQGAAQGDLGEVDLEMYEGNLVFNVDVGDKDVKVDASDGTVLAQVSEDDKGHEDED
jgi:uncharacterized membrane protein YkoI